MRRTFRDRSTGPLTLLCLGLLVLLCTYHLVAGPTPAPQAPAWQVVPAVSPYIDVHSHLNSPGRDAALVETVGNAMQLENISRILFLPPPTMVGDPMGFDIEDLAPPVKKYPGKFYFLGGGGSLNAMIQESVRTGDAGPDVQKKFKERAEEIARAGAVGFGEMSGEHLPRGAGGPGDYEHAPADHPLYLILSDVAAEHNMVIDLHMEAIPKTIPIPAGTLWAKMNPQPDPPVLKENIVGLERLLSHNPRAKIMWDHAAWDHSGFRSADLTRRLLRAHPNLYMSIKCDAGDPGLDPYMVDIQKGPIKPEWLAVLKEFPDRFTIGADQGYPLPKAGAMPRWQTTVLFFNQLPADLRQKIGLDNPIRIYGLK